MPAVIVVSADIVSNDEILAAVIEVAIIEPLAISKFRMSGAVNVILSQTKSLAVISIWFVICTCFKPSSGVWLSVNNCNAATSVLFKLISVVWLSVNNCNAAISSSLEIIWVVWLSVNYCNAAISSSL